MVVALAEETSRVGADHGCTVWTLPDGLHASYTKAGSLELQTAVSQNQGNPEWLALGSGHMDSNLRSPGGFMLTHAQLVR